MARTHAQPIRKSHPSMPSVEAHQSVLDFLKLMGLFAKSLRPDVNVRAERAKPYGLRSSPEGAFSFQHGGSAPCCASFDPAHLTRASVSSVKSHQAVLKDTLVSTICYLLRIPFRLAPRNASFNTPNSILIIKPCCLGDVLMATPVIVALRRAFPRTRIDFAVGGWSRAVVENNPHLDGLVDCGLVGSGSGYSWREYLDLVRRIRAGRYEACFVLDRSPLISLLPCLGDVPQRVGLDSRGRGFSLTVGLPAVAPKHEAEVYLDTVRAVGIEVNEPRVGTLALEFYPTEEDRRHVAEMLSKCQEVLSGQAPLIVIHPAGGSNPGMSLSAKRWPPQRFAALADRLVEERGAQVVLVGGPNDSPIAAAVKEPMRQKPWDLTGQLTLGQLGALLEQCDLFVGHDTGAMHLAVAVGTPVVAIFGPSDPRMYGPCSEKSVTLWHDVGCNPCLLHGRWNTACRRFRCIEAVTVEEVWQAAAAFLPDD